MLKLVRNTWGDLGYLKDPDGFGIKYSFIHKLHELQQGTGIHLKNKLRKQHIQYFKKKMNVRLAAQMLSDSVADAIEFCEKENLPGFEDCAPTIKFIRTINKLFDILNSRNLLANCYKKPICQQNSKTIFDFFVSATKYLRNISCPKSGKLIVDGNKKTGMLGFIVCMESTKNLYQCLLESGMQYLMTYKVSQDHLELFFGKIRNFGGCNNNPTARQFAAAYKRILIHNDLKDVMTGNCIPLESVPILRASSAAMNPQLKSPLYKQYVNELNSRSPANGIFNPTKGGNDLCESSEGETEDHDILDISSAFESNVTYCKNVVAYIAGFAVRKISKSLRCVDCHDALQMSLESIQTTPHLNFIRFVDSGGLIYPSDDVVNVYLTAEKCLQIKIKESCSNINLRYLVNSVSQSYIEVPVFLELDDHIRSGDPLNRHDCLLIKIIASCYLECRLSHLARTRSANIMLDKKPVSRQMANKLTLFRGQ